jgi:threonine dehydrogenase-like Zn-dependent dehydrogenase
MNTKDDKGYIIYPGLTAFPVIEGHEFCGEIVKAGKNALNEKNKPFETGDMVCAEEMLWCGRCVPCRDGYVNHCKNLDEVGFSINGAFAEYIKMDSKYVWTINSLLDRYKNKKEAFEAGALIEPFTSVYHGMFIRAGGIKPGSTVMIFGAGPIGLISIMLAKAAGASKVIVSELEDFRLKLAETVGADVCINPTKLNEPVYQKILEVTNDDGADMYIEATGSFADVWESIEKSIFYGEKLDSKTLIIGRSGRRASIWFESLQQRHAQIYGTQGHSSHGTFKNIIRLMSTGKINPRKMITNRYSLDNIIEAMENAKSKKSKQGKTIIKP